MPTVTKQGAWCSYKCSLTLVLLVITCLTTTKLTAGDDKFERGRMEGILDLVAKDVERNFYDSNLKGLDWKTVVEQARRRIRQSDHIGDMIGAIASVPYQLGDSHTVFIPPGRSARIDYGFEATPIGNDILVYKLKTGGPAERAGLQLGDNIVGVDGFAAKRGNFFEIMRYFEFLNPQTEMDLTIAGREGASQIVKIPTHVDQHGKQFADYNELRRMIDSEEPFYAYKEFGDDIAYVKLRSFLAPRTDVESVINKAKNSRAVIVDLRANGGGSRDTLVYLAGCFSGQPYEMAKEIGRSKTESIRVKPSYPQITSPVFVLVDSGSASASEMLARDLQMRRRAVVIGDRTGGRVNSARVFWEKIGAFDEVGFGTEIAVARVVMANGEELENRGVTPDEVCLPSPGDLRNQKDPCLDRALQLAKQQLSAKSTTMQSQ